MKKILYITFLLIATALYSCKTVTDNEVILFDGENRLAFTKDSVKVNLAELKVAERYKITLPVKVMGFVNVRDDRPFEVEIVSGVTNTIYSEPVVDKQYLKLPKNYVICKDSINGYVDVEFVGANFDADKTYEFRLKIKQNGYFNLGVVENLNSRIIVLNFLEKPTWWDNLGFTTDFNAIILSKLFEVLGKSPITDDDVWNNYMGTMAAFGKVSKWLNENPQFGVSFTKKDQEYIDRF